jgi:probable HAF family extracellular repeat protein
MQALGTVGTDPTALRSVLINDAGQIVGSSLEASFNPRAFLGVGQSLIDLNELIRANSPLYLFTACSTNSRG